MLVGQRSRRQIEPFSLHRPATLAEAVALHRQPGVSALLAGGVDLIDRLRHGHAIDRPVRIGGQTRRTFVKRINPASMSVKFARYAVG
jgi:carbon-monoxide dehydrogenase medium subunit